MAARNTHHADNVPAHGVAIWLDAYDDIFSDFDPRAYDSRALSDDFLTELRKLVREDDDTESIREFCLLIPARIRNEATENIISHRLHNYFRKVLLKLRDELRDTRRNGLLLLFSGLAFLLIAGFISFLHPSVLGLHLLMIALEPAGWFFIWLGYDMLFGSARRKRADVDFHLRMTRSRIVFKAL